ncbi:MAG: hypothetical protein QM687_09760 [Ferruginibacter sp.]
MKKMILAAGMLYASLLSAQPTNERGWYDSKDLEDIEIGWMNIIKFTAPSKPYTKDGWIYPATQTEFSKTIVQWWQQSYSPVGLLGEMKQSVLAPDPPLPVTNSSYDANEAEKDNKKALPNTYGAYAKLHKCMVKTSAHRFWPMYGNLCDIPWNIMANNVELLGRPMIQLSSPDAYYCVQPRFTHGMKGEYDKDWLAKYADYRNFTNSPNLEKYDHYYNPDFNRYTVIMTKDGKPLPFEQVTVAELIGRLESRFQLMFTMASAGGNKYPATRMQDAKKGLQIIKEKMKNNYNDFVYASATTVFDFTWLYNIDEKTDLSVSIKTRETVKDKNGYTSVYFPLLRLKKGVKEAGAIGGPQWIVFSLDLPVDPRYGGNVHLMDHFVSRFNYDYVYQYFFGAQKPAGPYRILSFSTDNDKKNALPAAVQSEEAAKMNANKSVLYYEDFSTVSTGATPVNWTTERSQHSGEKVTVVEIDGVKGKWLQLRRSAVPNNITLDYKISFDILTRKGDVLWGTPGIELQLNNGSTQSDPNGSFTYGINVTPGDMNRPDAAGWVTINQSMPAAYGKCRAESYYSIPQFTGSKNINRVTMSIVKKGENIKVLCNNTTVYECDKAAPADLSFKNLRFYVNEKNVYHISNILIKR